MDMDKRTWITAASMMVWGLIILFLIAFHGQIVGALETYRAGGPTIEGRPRVSIKDFLYEIATGKLLNYGGRGQYGLNNDVGTTFEILWDYSGGSPFISGATTVKLTSTSTADTTQTISVFGVDGDYNEQTEVATLNGRNPVTLTNTFLRVLDIENTGVVPLVGTVYAAGLNATYAAGVPQEPSLVLNSITLGNEKSLAAIYTIPAGYRGYIIEWHGSTSLDKTSTIALQTRIFGDVFVTRRNIKVYRSSFNNAFAMPMVVEEKADIQMAAFAKTAGGEITGGFHLWIEPK
jgi:hypothetical protein